MKDINYFTVGQNIYTNIAIFKLTSKYHSSNKEFYVPVGNSEIEEFLFNYPTYAEYLDSCGWYIDSLVLHSNGKDYEIF